MKTSALEVTVAINQRPGLSGLSPAPMLFGQRLKLYGELYANEEPAGHHPNGDNADDVLARRFKTRSTAIQALEMYHARELVRRSVAARTRALEKVEAGDLVFFYREYVTNVGRKQQAQRGNWMGPALVIGKQRSNLWISFGGRSYLVAPEHLRGPAPDEEFVAKPIVQESLSNLRAAAKSQDFIDLSKQDIPVEELNASLDQPAADDPYQPFDDEDAGTVAAQPPTEAEPLVELPPEEPEEPQAVNEQEEVLFPPIEANSTQPAPAVRWEPIGKDDALQWQKRPGEDDGDRPNKTSRSSADAADVMMLQRKVESCQTNYGK